MTSYQKLKEKCEYLQRQLDIFKNALTVANTEPNIIVDDSKDFVSLYMQSFYSIREKQIDEELKQRLNSWVAENLDEETILRLLEIKRKCAK